MLGGTHEQYCGIMSGGGSVDTNCCVLPRCPDHKNALITTPREYGKGARSK